MKENTELKRQIYNALLGAVIGLNLFEILGENLNQNFLGNITVWVDLGVLVYVAIVMITTKK